MYRTLLSLLLLALNLCACQDSPTAYAPEAQSGIYHWKTTFDPSPQELRFLSEHNIRRLYLRMFDVALQEDNVVPIATTRFRQRAPEGVEVVPTVFITNEAILSMAMNDPEQIGELIIQRIRNMMSYNQLGQPREIQIDCDWTKRSRSNYFRLLAHMRELLAPDSIALSTTLRLHQLADSVPPADRASLMLYNTGHLMSPATQNSILDIDDVRPYLRRTLSYPMPIDIALPAFRWGVEFRDGKFYRLVSQPDSLASATTLRLEESRPEHILAAKQLAQQRIKAPMGHTILYHLDSLQLSKFTSDEIQQIYSRP